MKYIHIHPMDNVAVALETLAKGETVEVREQTGPAAEGLSVTAMEEIPRGHKIALQDIKAGEEVIKYGNVIAVAKEDIPAGKWVHTHNVKTQLSEEAEYTYDHKT